MWVYLAWTIDLNLILFILRDKVPILFTKKSFARFMQKKIYWTLFHAVEIADDYVICTFLANFAGSTGFVDFTALETCILHT